VKRTGSKPGQVLARCASGSDVKVLPSKGSVGIARALVVGTALCSVGEVAIPPRPVRARADTERRVDKTRIFVERPPSPSSPGAADNAVSQPSIRPFVSRSTVRDVADIGSLERRLPLRRPAGDWAPSWLGTIIDAIHAL
jgi:hypothetical protein